MFDSNGSADNHQVMRENLRAINGILAGPASAGGAQSGHVVIFAGGGGESSALILQQPGDAEGRVFSVDRLRAASLKAEAIKADWQAASGRSLDAFNLANQTDVAELGGLVSEALNLSSAEDSALIASAMAAAPGDKPNIVAYVALTGLWDLLNVSAAARALGYPVDNIHIVWMVNDTAQARQNGDAASDALLVNKLGIVSQTMAYLINMNNGLGEHMTGCICLLFKGEGTTLSEADGDVSRMDGVPCVTVRKRGGPGLRLTQLGAGVLAEIKRRVPNPTVWDVAFWD